MSPPCQLRPIELRWFCAAETPFDSGRLILTLRVAGSVPIASGSHVECRMSLTRLRGRKTPSSARRRRPRLHGGGKTGQHHGLGPGIERRRAPPHDAGAAEEDRELINLVVVLLCSALPCSASRSSKENPPDPRGYPLVAQDLCGGRSRSSGAGASIPGP